MPDPRELAGDEASRAEVEFNRVVGIASTRRDRGELSAGAYAVILDRARKSRDWGGVGPKTKGRAGSRAPCAETSARGHPHC
jgi:hypothetical protein